MKRLSTMKKASQKDQQPKRAKTCQNRENVFHFETFLAQSNEKLFLLILHRAPPPPPPLRKSHNSTQN